MACGFQLFFVVRGQAGGGGLMWFGLQECQAGDLWAFLQTCLYVR